MVCIVRPRGSYHSFIHAPPPLPKAICPNEADRKIGFICTPDDHISSSCPHIEAERILASGIGAEDEPNTSSLKVTLSAAEGNARSLKFLR